MMRFRIRIEKWCQIKHFVQHVTWNDYHDGMNEVKGMKRSKNIRKVVK